jgi:G:T-mismatch repair DNA endonuclease (very short patch repair protein)
MADLRYNAEEAYQRTLRRKADIEKLGFTVVEIWECDYRRELVDNPAMKEFVDSIELVEPLDPREGKKVIWLALYFCF